MRGGTISAKSAENMELINIHTKVTKVWPYRTAYLEGAPLEVPRTQTLEDDLVRWSPKFAGEIKGRNHIVIGLEGGLYLWISDRTVYIGTKLVEESW